MSKPLKPCPFCGVVPNFVQYGDMQWIIEHSGCTFLDESIGPFYRLDAAITAWNTRKRPRRKVGG